MSIHPAMRPVRRMVQCEGIVSLAMPCYFRCPKFRNFIVMFMKVCFVYTVNEHQVITDEE